MIDVKMLQFLKARVTYTVIYNMKLRDKLLILYRRHQEFIIHILIFTNAHNWMSC